MDWGMAQKAELLTVPIEIRLRIYEYLFLGGKLVIESKGFELSDVTTIAVLIHTPPSANMLRTCRYCLEEALPLFYRYTMYICTGERAYTYLKLMVPPANRKRIVNLSGVRPKAFWGSRPTDPAFNVFRNELNAFGPIQNFHFQSFGASVDNRRRVISKSSLNLSFDDCAKMLKRTHGPDLRLIRDFGKQFGLDTYTVSFGAELCLQSKNNWLLESYEIPHLIDMSHGRVVKFSNRITQLPVHFVSDPNQPHEFSNCSEFDDLLKRVQKTEEKGKWIVFKKCTPHYNPFHRLTGWDIYEPMGTREDPIVIT